MFDGRAPNLSDYLEEDGSVPDSLDADQLKALYFDAIAWWDEMHKKCSFGDFREGAKDQTRFPRNADGSYNPDGEYRDLKWLNTL